ncbi:MAG TPA: hypothetical protein VHO24_20120 [Opitutaceae bacterium]|nr:hypothetical protein [Opitutaceae bacterium]
MFSIFRRKPSPGPLTFNERVDAFWRWFQGVAPRFYATIEAGNCSDLSAETSAKADELFPGFAWVFGPGEGGKGHSFTLTGEGNVHRQLLALQWLSRAPAITGWTFHAARQPGPIKGHVIEIADMNFDPQEIWVTPRIDKENEKIDLTVWHPAWERIEERQRHTVTFLFLDEALGEYGTDWWIGEIKFGRDRLGDSFPLEELADYVSASAENCGWKKYPPGESCALFSFKQAPGDFPRGDIRTQTTCVSRLVADFMNAAGEFDDPLAGSGADYVYVSIAASFFPPGDEVTRRGEIEEAVEAALKKIQGGRWIGGALGTERGYCDFLIFDGKRSLTAIQKALASREVPAGTMIEFFAREKRGRRIAL